MIPARVQIDAIKVVYPSGGDEKNIFCKTIYKLKAIPVKPRTKPEKKVATRGTLLKEVIAVMKWPNLFGKL